MSAKQSLDNCLSRWIATAVLLQSVLLLLLQCCCAAVLLQSVLLQSVLLLLLLQCCCCCNCVLLQLCGGAATVCWQVSQLNAELELQKEKFGVRMSEVQASCSQQVNQLAAVADCCCCGTGWWH